MKNTAPSSIMHQATHYFSKHNCKIITNPNYIHQARCCRCGEIKLMSRSIIPNWCTTTDFHICDTCSNLLDKFERIEVGSSTFMNQWKRECTPAPIYSEFSSINELDEPQYQPIKDFNISRKLRHEVLRYWYNPETIKDELLKSESFFTLYNYYSLRKIILRRAYKFIINPLCYCLKVKLSKKEKKIQNSNLRNCELFLIHESIKHHSRETIYRSLAEVRLSSYEISVKPTDYTLRNYNFIFNSINKYFALAVIISFFTCDKIANKRELLYNNNTDILNIFSELGIRKL